MNGECQLQNNTKKISEKILSVGQVDFINCLPVNLFFKTDYKVINDIPSNINKLILSGEVDVAPVSSITYLKNKNKLSLFADLCIGSNGPCDSVLLFSNTPINELNNKKIALSHASETSNKLLEIILGQFYGFKNNFIIENNSLDNLINHHRYNAVLLIGDFAIRESSTKKLGFIYDLGEIWKQHTGLPMVFATWVIRKDIDKNLNKVINDISSGLHIAKNYGLSEGLKTTVKHAQEKVFKSEDFYKNYFKHLNYDFTEEYKKGLELFEEYALKEKIFS